MSAMVFVFVMLIVAVGLFFAAAPDNELANKNQRAQAENMGACAKKAHDAREGWLCMELSDAGEIVNVSANGKSLTEGLEAGAKKKTGSWEMECVAGSAPGVWKWCLWKESAAEPFAQAYAFLGKGSAVFALSERGEGPVIVRTLLSSEPKPMEKRLLEGGWGVAS